MKDITWLQISDLHVFDEVDTSFMLNDFELLAKKIHPSFLLVTGDFKHILKNNDFSNALKYLNGIVNAFKLDKKDVFLIPGNHDVNDYDGRKDDIADICKNLSSNYGFYSKYMGNGKDHCLLNSFSKYKAFVHDFYQGSDVSGNRIDMPESVFCECWNKKINILCANTALISDGNRSHGQIVDLIALNDCNICNPKVPTILIAHNAFQDLEKSFQDRVNTIMLHKNIPVYINGDVHKIGLSYIPKKTPTSEGGVCISGPKSAPESGDNYSDIGAILYTWKKEISRVELQAYEWNSNGFVESPAFTYNVNEKWFFEFGKKPKEKQLKNQKTIEVSSEKFVDKLGDLAFSKKKANAMTSAILVQDAQNVAKKIGSIKKTNLTKLCNDIQGSDKACPLVIKGLPGTGKSTLLSMIYLQLMENKKNTYLFDLHYLDDKKKNQAEEILEEVKKHIETLIREKDEVFLLLDGLNQYIRHYGDLDAKLRRSIEKWKKKKNVKIVYTLGVLEASQYPPFERSGETEILEAEKELNFGLVDTSSANFAFLVSTLLDMRNLNSDQARDRIITTCRTIDNGKSSLRTAWFMVRQFDNEGDTVFNAPIGKLFYDYYTTKIGLDKMKSYSRRVAEFMLREKKGKMPDVITIKGTAAMDFFFSFNYVEACIQQKFDYIKKLDIIFPIRINRFIVHIAQLDSQNEECFFENLALLMMTEELSVYCKIQIAYFLGRANVSERAIADAKACLIDKYKQQLEGYKKSNKSIEEAMLLRTLGISLIYLGYTDHEDQFYSLMIFDEAMNRINRSFHIEYYIFPESKLIARKIVDMKDMYSLENIKKVYSFLYHNIEKTSEEKTKIINIITLISFVVYWKYDSHGREQSIEEFSSFTFLMDKLVKNQNMPDVVHNYISFVLKKIQTKSFYKDSLIALYKFKTLGREGWIKRKIDSHVDRVESDAEHTWACCMIADLLLPENIYDCELIKDYDKYKNYNKHKVLSILLVHDLAECITGDIADPDKKKEDEVDEERAIDTIRAFGAFPCLSELYNIANLCSDFRQRDSKNADINIRIASDIDRIEPLIQLYMYRQHLEKPYDFKEVERWIKRDKFIIHTSFGNELMALLDEIILQKSSFEKND